MDEGGSSARHPIRQQLARVFGRHEQHLNRWEVRSDDQGGGQAIDGWHVNVHPYKVGLEPLDDLDGFRAITPATYDDLGSNMNISFQGSACSAELSAR